MRSCSTCGKPFEPGDRTCGACGRSRSTTGLSSGPSPAADDDQRWRPAGGGGSPFAGGHPGASPAPPRDREPGSPAPVAFAAPTGAVRGLAGAGPRAMPSTPPLFPPPRADAGPTAWAAAAGQGSSAATAPTLPPWERDLDAEPAWEELVGPDGEPGHDAVGTVGDVSVGRGRMPWRRVVAAAMVGVVALAVGAAVLDRSGGGASATVGDLGIERRLPGPIAHAPSVLWRAAGLGSSIDESANGGGGGLVVADGERIFAVPGDGRNQLNAVDLTTGRTSWTVALDEVAMQLYQVDGAVVVAHEGRIVAYDASTGRQRWNAVGQFVYQPWPGGPLVSGRFGSGAPTLAVLDPVTGHERWATANGAAGNWWADRSGLFWPTCAGVQRLDWNDGSARWTFATGTDACDAERSRGIVVAGDTAIAHLADRFVGLDVATGSQRWTLPSEDARLDRTIVLDRGHVAITEHRPSDADRVRVLDVASGQFTPAEIDGHFEVVHVRQGDKDALYAFNGSSLRAVDPSSYEVADTSVPLEGYLPSPLGDRALATDTTYAVLGVGGDYQLVAHSLSSGALRWSTDVPVGSRLISVGKVLVLLDGRDLVAYG